MKGVTKKVCDMLKAKKEITEEIVVEFSNKMRKSNIVIIPEDHLIRFNRRYLKLVSSNSLAIETMVEKAYSNYQIADKIMYIGWKNEYMRYITKI